jgi:dTMP kinase
VLRAEGRDVLSVREPGGTPIGEQIRRLLLDPDRRELDARTEMLLFAASRAQLVAEVIRPALGRGTLVACDRYVDASLAYQGCGRGLGFELVRAVNAAGTDGLVPDLTLLLDVDPVVGLRRARAAAGSPGRSERWTGGDRLERETLAFHERVREGFLSLARNDPARIRVVDARGTPDEVHRAVMRLVRARFAAGPQTTEGRQRT